MNPETKEISDNVKKDKSTVKLRLRYPYLSDETKAAKRINGCLDGVFASIKEKAEKSLRFSYFSCCYSCYLSDNGYFSVRFDLVGKGRNKAYSYSPFSFTFDPSGRAVPLFDRLPKREYKKAKAEFAYHGIKLSKKEFLYSYYLTGRGAVIYAARKRAPGRNGYVYLEYETGRKEPG